MDDDWLYETFGVEKPKDYNQQKADALAIKQALSQKLNDDSKDDDSKDSKNGNDDSSSPINAHQSQSEPNNNRPSNAAQTTFKSRLKRFFAVAPKGADTDF